MLSILLLIFQYKPVQTWAAKKATKYLSNELHTKIDIKSLYIKPFSSVVLEDLYVLDRQNDTLLRTPKLTVNLSKFSIFSSIPNRVLNLDTITLDRGSFYLKKLKDSTTNLQFIIDYFNSGAKTPKQKSKPWTINLGRINIKDLHFRYKNFLDKRFTSSSINFEDLDVHNFTAAISNIDLKNHLFKARLSRLTLKEKSGFYVKNFTANATIDTNQILLQNFYLLTPHSRLKDYFRMRFKSFDDFDDFEDKVYMDADFRSARVSSRDIAYFTTSLGKTHFDLSINGRVNGLVNNLTAHHALISGGQATYLKGDFHLKGLPYWEKTYLDLDFEQLATNKKDLDNIIGGFAGDSQFKLPEFLDKFGFINFTGHLRGYQDNFVTKGSFKTKLGRFDPDIRLILNKVPGYVGKVTLYDFDVATLLNDSSLGRASLDANINGSGDEIKNLNIKGDAKIDYVDFNGYRYTNLSVNGSFIRNMLDGNVRMNDRNAKINMHGGIDLNPKLPVYHIDGLFTDVKLRSLGFINDTITVSAQLKTRFSGDNLKNLQGSIVISPLRIVDPRHNYLVDSVNLTASGVGNAREISLRSDLADASIKGNYDLATLPSYFKTLVKRYIPSLKMKIVKPGLQNFTFDLKLKNLDPVTAIFAPDLKIPEQGTFNGQFNSAAETATLNGYIKTIQYGSTVFHDFILDESTTNQYMGINLSLNKVDLTDSLFVKNITVTNFLQRDSLKFNVKLSDKTARNQLDLYGLVEFGRDTTAKLKLLPSDVVLETEKWRLNEQVRIRLLDGKTQIEGFELANGDQKVRLNGFISGNTADKLKVEFEKFSMGTLNQLTKPAGVKMRGLLNGDVILTSILKTPGVDANLGIDSMMMNNTLIGNVKIVSDFDNTSKKANVKMNILNRGLETLNLGGTYNLGKDGAPLDFDIKMNQTEAVIFQPFVKGLVSNLKGTISTNLKLTGSPSAPSINGDISLNNTQLTVDYLKTRYTVSDKLSVNNSVIQVSDMKLTDYKGGQGIANGKVDLTNLSNPTINVELTARNLLALNTTFKDNRLYYGKAFASGTFKFNGPIDNMNIDIDASTQDSTVFNIPLNTSVTAGDYDFIKFVSHKDTAKVAATTNAFNGVTLNFNLRADERTVVRIGTDYGQLEGRGKTSDLRLKINSLGDFDMYGDFLITSGKFEFTAQNFISKVFTVNQGGTIRWTGDPSNADINLEAIYEVRTDISALYQAAGTATTKANQQLVQAKLILTHTLLHPTIDFDFSFPNDPSIKDELGTYLTDYNNRSQQALSLIVRRQFSSGGYGNNVTNQVKQTAADAVSEFAFNKLNNLISQSNIKGFDINFRSATDASASLRLFKDRLILNGSLYSTQLSNNLFNANQNLFNSNLNNYTKDFEIDYLIRSDGRLRARYSYRVLNNNTLNTLGTDQLNVQYVNGLGLIYQRDFDTFGEFIRSLFFRRRNRPKDQQGNTPPLPNATVNEVDQEDK